MAVTRFISDTLGFASVGRESLGLATVVEEVARSLSSCYLRRRIAHANDLVSRFVGHLTLVVILFLLVHYS